MRTNPTRLTVQAFAGAALPAFVTGGCRFTMHRIVIDGRKALTQDIEQISFKLGNHAFWRAAQLLVVVLMALVLGPVAVIFSEALAHPKSMKSINPQPGG